MHETAVYLPSFIQAVEQLFFLFLLVGMSWAWVCLGVFCQGLARDGTDESARLQQNQSKYAGLQATNPTLYARSLVFDGSYIQTAPSVICCVFLATGSAFFVSRL